MRILIVKTSFIFLGVFLATCVFLGVTSSVSMLTAGPLHALLILFSGLVTLSLVAFLVVHCAFIFSAPEKKVHIIMATLILGTMMVAFPLSNKWQHCGHRRWFLEKALPEYQEAVHKIMQNPSVLNDQASLQLLVGLPMGCSYVHGKIVSDGLVSVYFSGGDHWREGYAYFSRIQTNSGVYHYLTNNWYEY
ncbi:MAG: hypothetical protein P4L79_16230 [Legionella sp.]|uniref:hypothetical protein n=1 Tax=Legionella sp. TaxID=459 RepID=UPI00285049A1|nr:hypothetical protein [Legionella sp.]